MSLFFWLNNIHYSLQLFGGLAFLLVAWLAIDSFLIRRDFITFSRGLGFLFLAVWGCSARIRIILRVVAKLPRDRQARGTRFGTLENLVYLW